MQEEKQIFGLYKVMQAISRQVDEATGGKAFWLRAEISQIQFAASGHCYLDLVEQENGATIAKSRAVIWKGQLFSIKKTLKNDFKNILKQGTEVVFLAQISFSPIYGLNIQIIEIDAGFNMGMLEKRKQETIKKLQKSGAMDVNKQLSEPQVIQKIALIASEKSAAYQDFMSHLVNSEEQPYKFEVTLFHAPVQGDNAVPGMLKSLELIKVEDFEAVVIIRGGGSKLDLEPFNDFDLSMKVTYFPLPVLTGIGHETDMSVLDMLVRSPHKTPTAVADYLVDKCVAFEKDMYQMYLQVSRSAKEVIKRDQLALGRFLEILKKDPVNYCQLKRGRLHDLFQSMERITNKLMVDYRSLLQDYKSVLSEKSTEKIKYLEQQKINQIQQNIFQLAQQKLVAHIQKMEGLTDTLGYLSPEKTLKRGFSITRKNQQSITTIKNIAPKEEVEIEVLDGYFTSVIQNIRKKDNNNGEKGN